MSGIDRRKDLNMKTQHELTFLDLENAYGGIDDPIIRYTVNYEDEGGHKYSYTVNNQRDDLIKGMKVTYSDGNGRIFTATAD